MPGTALSTSQFCLNGVFHIPLNLEYVSPVGRMSEFKPCCKNPMKVLPDWLFNDDKGRPIGLFAIFHFFGVFDLLFLMKTSVFDN